MTARKTNRRSQTTPQQNDAPNLNSTDVRDMSNPIQSPTSESVAANSNKPDDAQSTITLKQLLTDRKIKTDPKLIRRVLRKYYTSKINHQHRDAWVFPTDHADNVVALIDKHCRAAKSA